MKTGWCKHKIQISIAGSVTLDEREAAFLRAMAEHCIRTKMVGSFACAQLVRALDHLGVPASARLPVYGLFEEA